ncbi:MAG: hypothetical protein ABSH51_29650, partial [Solirubrobacteraceae bacterium]
MEAHLSSHHRDTIGRIFSRPPSRNVEWGEVMSLLETIGTVTHEHNGKLRVALGPESEVLPAPRGKDVEIQIVVDLRRMLTQAGFAPDGPRAIAEQPDEPRHDPDRWRPGSWRAVRPGPLSRSACVGAGELDV